MVYRLNLLLHYIAEVCTKKNSSLGLVDTAVVATLRSRVLSLEREIEELKSEPKVCGTI